MVLVQKTLTRPSISTFTIKYFSRILRLVGYVALKKTFVAVDVVAVGYLGCAHHNELWCV